MEMVCESGTCRPYRSAGDAGHLWVLCLRDRRNGARVKRVGDGDQREAQRQPAGRPSSGDPKYEKAMKVLAKPGVLRFKI